jgi:hypothetical protein
MPTFYRILKTATPTLADFLSYAELGILLLYDTAEGRRRARGLSMYDDVAAARARARPERGRSPGDYVAAVDLAEVGPLTWRQTGADLNHYTIEGEMEERAAYLLGRMRGVMPV